MTEVASSLQRDRVRSLLARRAELALRGTLTGAGIPHRDPTKPVQPSSTQARLWFLARLEPDSAAYNLPVVLLLTGQLDANAMTAAIHDVAEQHEVLRSVYREVDGELEIVILAAEAVQVGRSDVAAAEVDDVVAARASRPFALSDEPPMRAELLRVAVDEHVLLLTFHHVALDAESVTVVLDDLAVAYTERCAGTTAPRPPGLQYADYVEWAAREPGGKADDDVRWWSERLTGLPLRIELPTDRPRSGAGGDDGDEVPVALPARTVERLRAVCDQTATTPFMVLLTCWQALLGRLADTEDVAVGVPHSGRTHPDLARVVGCFVDTLVLRTDLSGRPTARQLLDVVRTGVLDAFAHTAAPFERIVERVAPDRDLGTAPFFQVMLNVLDDQPADPVLPGLAVRRAEPPLRTAKFDLTLTLARDGDGYRGGLGFRTERFDRGSAERIARWLVAMVDQLTADLDRCVDDIVLEAVTGPVLAGPPAVDVDQRPVHVLIEQAVDRTPDAIAVTDASGSLTYRELDARASQVAHRLLALGVRPDDRIGLLLEQGTDLACALLGVLKAGAAYLPMDTTYPASRVRGIVDSAQVRVVLAQPGLPHRLDGLGAAVLTVDDAVVGQPAHRPRVDVRGSDLIHVIFTSGSTGAPKGVAVEHRNVSHYLGGVLGRIRAAGVAGAASFAVVSTPAADFGLTCVYGALTTGGTVHLVDRDTAMDPDLFARYLAEHPVDVLKCVPSHLELLAEYGDLASVLPRQLLILAGEACPWTLIDRVERANPELCVQSHYGHTESTMISLTCDVADVPARDRVGFVPLGRPLPAVVGYLVDRAGRPVPDGVPGELVIGGPQISRGYLGNVELTRERFVDGPLGDGTRCYRSGDLLRVRADGMVEFRGRVDDQVKIRGHRVELDEVRTALQSVDGVGQAAVLPFGDGMRRRLAAWLVPEPGATVDVGAVRRTVREGLPDYMVPSALTVLDRMPLNANGKLDRAALPAPVDGSNGSDARPRQPVTTPAQLLVARCWREVLAGEDFFADDDFFAVGGHSFAAVRVAARLSRALGVDVAVRAVFEHPVLADLAAALTAGRVRPGRGSGGIPRRGDPGLPAPLSPAQARFWFRSVLDPQSSADNTDIVFRLRGPLVLGAMVDAVRDVAERHEVLRSVLPEHNGVPAAVVVSATQVPVPVVDIAAEDVDAAVAAGLSRPFALDREPPMRATLLRLGPQEHVLAITVHHIATDNWSRRIIAADLATAYSARVRGTPMAEAPPVQYADYAAWNATRQARPQAAADLDWWCEHLSELPPVLKLPTDRPRPTVSTWSGGTVPFTLSPALTERVRAAAAAVDGTPFMVLLAAWQWLLGRLAGTDDVAVGVPESGRHHSDIESTVGCFINTLVIRADIGGDPTGRELLRRTRGRVLDAFAHAETPLESIVDRLRPDRSAATTPLFQVLLNVIDEPQAPPRVDGLRVEPMRFHQGSVKVDLSLVMANDGECYRGGLAYRSDLFDPETAQQHAEDFQLLLEAMVADLDAPVSTRTAGGTARPSQPDEPHLPVAPAARPDRPGTPTERHVASVWSEVLGIDDIGLDDDFFAIGGHSFAAVRAVRAIGGELRVIDLFLHPTVRQLATRLDCGSVDATPGGRMLHRLTRRPAGSASVTLVAVPYGGGSAAVFQPLAAELDADPDAAVDLLAVEPPGHDAARPDEPPLTIDELVDAVAAEVKATVTGRVAVYGHCVGSAVATALAGRLEADGVDVAGVIVAGSFPSARLPGRVSSWLQRIFPRERWVSDRLFRDTLRATGGLVDDMDEKASVAMLRALRHDSAQAQAWFGRQLRPGPTRPVRLTAPLLCIVGAADPATDLYQERHREWGAFAERVQLDVIPRAGHYFVRHQAATVARQVTARLAQWAAGDLPAPVAELPVAGRQAQAGLRAFYTVAAGQAVSLIGNELTMFALGVWAYQRSGRMADLAMVILLSRLPALLLTPVGGAVADRFDRRRIMLGCDAVGGVAMVVLTILLATDRLTLPGVCVIVGVTSMITAFHRPAYLAAISQLVPKPYLTQANALAESGASLGMVVGPLLGGLLMALSGLPSVVIADVATFAVGLTTLLIVRFPNRLFHTRDEPFRRALTGGLRFVVRRRPMLVMIGYFAVVNYCTALMWVALTPLVLSVGSTAQLGVVTAVGGIGALVGTAIMVAWGGTPRRATGMIVFVVGSGVGVLVMGLWPSVAIIAVGFFLRLACMSIGNAHWLAITQTKVGQQLQGRVLAINVMLATAMQPLGFLTAAPLAGVLGGLTAGSFGGMFGSAEHAGPAALMACSGVFLLLWGLLGLRTRSLRDIEELLPDAAPDAEVPDDLDAVQADADKVLVR